MAQQVTKLARLIEAILVAFTLWNVFFCARSAFGQETRKFQLKGPTFISVVYPVLRIDDELLELSEPISEAYNFWGKTIISSFPGKSYFPAPLSYPYKFSKKGLATLENKLRRIPEIEPTSIKRKTFPNIPTEYHYVYEANELKNSLIYEEYLAFRLTAWDNVEFMRFPTFLVMAFDYAEKPNVPYERVRLEWNEKVSQLQKLENLSSILGVSRKGEPWSHVPLLTFSALAAYSEVDFWNYFWGGNVTPVDSKRRFLGEVSVRRFSGEIDPSDTLVTHCHGISYEKPRFSVWRFYYARYPVFYDREFASRRDSGPFEGSHGSLYRILRTALFINLVLPRFENLLKTLDIDITRILTKMRDERLTLINEFSSDHLSSLEATLVRATSEVENRIDPLLDRVDEAKKAYEQLIEDIKIPFAPPTNLALRAAAQKNKEQCVEPFEMGDRGTDLYTGSNIAGQIKQYTQSVNLKRDRLGSQIASATILLENGRALVEERENTNKAIDAGNENTKNAIKAGNESTKDAIAATFVATELAIVWGLVGAIGGALIATLFGFILTHKYDTKRLNHLDKGITQAVAEQKRQTTIQDGLGQSFDKVSRELDQVKTYLQALDRTVNQGIEKLQEQSSRSQKDEGKL